MELDKILFKMESDVTRMGIKFEDYLKHMKKTKEELQKEFKGEAEKRAKLALILIDTFKLAQFLQHVQSTSENQGQHACKECHYAYYLGIGFDFLNEVVMTVQFLLKFAG